MRKWLKEAAILAALCLGPVLLTGKVHSQIIDPAPSWCSGYPVGAFCLFLFEDDPTICQDCVQVECDYACIYGVPNPSASLQAYRYCITIGFATCLGGLIAPL
jgi:hypothetical protein